MILNIIMATNKRSLVNCFPGFPGHVGTLEESHELWQCDDGTEIKLSHHEIKSRFYMNTVKIANPQGNAHCLYLEPEP